MSNIIDKLFNLLENGTSVFIRDSAARQIGIYFKQNPNDIKRILSQIKKVLLNNDWESRVSAGKAVEHLILNLQSLQSWIDILRAHDILQDKDSKLPRDFDVDIKILHQFMQLSILDAGKNIAEKEEKTLNTITRKERIKLEKQKINNQLGLGIKVGNHSLCEISSIILEEDLEIYQAESAANILQESKFKFPYHIIQNVPKNTFRSKAISDLKETIINDDPVHLLFMFLVDHSFADDQIFHAKWEIRHACCILLRHFLYAEIADSDQAPFNGYYFRLEPILVRMFALIVRDRFGDYVGEQVIAPIREMSAQIISLCVALVSKIDVDKGKWKLSKIIETYALMLSGVKGKCDSAFPWAIRHGAILGLKYLLPQVFQSQFDWHSSINLILPLLQQGLKDLSDDVMSISADLLIFLCDKPCDISLKELKDMSNTIIHHLNPRIFADESSVDSMTILQEDSTTSLAEKNLILLIRKIIERNPECLSFDAEKNYEKSYVEWLMDAMVFRYLYHISGEVRLNAMLTFTLLLSLEFKEINVTLASNVNSKFISIDKFAHYMMQLYKRVLIEDDSEVLESIEKAWIVLMSREISPSVATTSLVTLVGNHLDNMICLAMHRSDVPIQNLGHSYPKTSSNDLGHDGTKFYIGGIDSLNFGFQERETNVVTCRLAACRLLSIMLYRIFNDMEDEKKNLTSMVQYHHFLRSFETLIEFHLSSHSAVQRFVGAMFLQQLMSLFALWIHRNPSQNLPQTQTQSFSQTFNHWPDFDRIYSKLPHYLSESFYFDESAPNLFEIQNLSQKIKDKLYKLTPLSGHKKQALDMPSHISQLINEQSSSLTLDPTLLEWLLTEYPCPSSVPSPIRKKRCPVPEENTRPPCIDTHLHSDATILRKVIEDTREKQAFSHARVNGVLICVRILWMIWVDKRANQSDVMTLEVETSLNSQQTHKLPDLIKLTRDLMDILKVEHEPLLCRRLCEILAAIFVFIRWQRKDAKDLSGSLIYRMLALGAKNGGPFGAEWLQFDRKGLNMINDQQDISGIIISLKFLKQLNTSSPLNRYCRSSSSIDLPGIKQVSSDFTRICQNLCQANSILIHHLRNIPYADDSIYTTNALLPITEDKTIRSNTPAYNAASLTLEILAQNLGFAYMRDQMPDLWDYIDPVEQLKHCLGYQKGIDDLLSDREKTEIESVLSLFENSESDKNVTVQNVEDIGKFNVGSEISGRYILLKLHAVELTLPRYYLNFSKSEASLIRLINDTVTLICHNLILNRIPRARFSCAKIFRSLLNYWPDNSSPNVSNKDIVIENIMNTFTESMLNHMESSLLRVKAGFIEGLIYILSGLEIHFSIMLPYTIIFALPCLGLMTDSNEDVRKGASHCFISIIKYISLNVLNSSTSTSTNTAFKSNVNLLAAFDRGKMFLTHLLSGQLDQINDQNLSELIDLKPGIELRHYQLHGVNWLAFLKRYKLHGILCDDMGLGKTLQAICGLVLKDRAHQSTTDTHVYCKTGIDIYNHEKENIESPKISLVLCPQTLVYYWIEEVEKFIPGHMLKPFAFVDLNDETALKTVKAIITNSDKFISFNHVLCVCSYELIRKNGYIFSKLFDDVGFSGGFTHLVLDEGHVIKNSKTKLAKIVKNIPARHRLILSGTPVQNNVLELWSLFDFLMPGYLGTEKEFNNTFGKPILQSRDAKNSSKEQEAGITALESLHKLILPFILRRTKEQVLSDLPPKIIQDYYCPMTWLQLELIDDFINLRAIKTPSEHNSSSSLDKTNITKPIHAFEALNYMRKICNHPGFVLLKLDTNIPEENGKLLWLLRKYHTINESISFDGADDTAIEGGTEGSFKGHFDLNRSLQMIMNDPGVSGKLMALVQLLKECQIIYSSDTNLNEEVSKKNAAEGYDGSWHKVLIFFQFIDTLKLVSRCLQKYSVPYSTLDGTVSLEDRHKIVKDFNRDPFTFEENDAKCIKVLLLTTKIGGLGLNLTAADVVIFYEHDWNPMKDLQAMDRAHRIGQTKVVNVYRLITKDTFEEKILGLQKFKMAVANSIVNKENSDYRMIRKSSTDILDFFATKFGNPSSNSPSPANSNISQKASFGESSHVISEQMNFGEGSAIDRKKKKVGLHLFLKELESLWGDECQYDNEFDIDSFVAKLK